jgi:hypothetical protein
LKIRRLLGFGNYTTKINMVLGVSTGKLTSPTKYTAITSTKHENQQTFKTREFGLFGFFQHFFV